MSQSAPARGDDLTDAGELPAFPDLIVIGAGVIGITIALRARARGLAVTVIDRKGVCAETSAGNAGAFAFSEIEPLAAPGILRKAPGWLLDPLGPLALPPSYAPRIAPWLWRFWRASRPARFGAGLAAQARLMALSRSALERLIAETGAGHLLRRDGALDLYESEAEFRASLPLWEERRAQGIDFVPLTGRDAIAAHQPGLSPRLTHGVFVPGWINVVDPADWTRRLARIFTERGGSIGQATARAITPEAGAVSVHRTDGPPLRARRVVVAAGAWSRPLALSLGDRLPLETERGYNTTLPAGAFDLRLHITFPGHGFVVSRINDGLRVGGAVELGGLARPPDYRRSRALLRKAEGFLPGLATSGGTEWMGFRPSMPDSLPVISPAGTSADVIYAFGHGHLGLTQSAGTAELVADMLTGRDPALAVDAFAASRFRQGR
ncbi:MAG: FAD-dependent oxidoreductase [Defluviimonas sp.]|uniref:NAD(P)/FAD-dependent oxidoreductase n=1 Tax=Albidovulum sp. TaxID=1872424 RepID=UPI001D82A805|nr:FAD-dependent oxidoreductase [Paracoccaceae bacterium]MCC0062869.1 FAD-dependent oxidoreductase [Defluviimonas sp.]